jgi:hypothetical protein
MFAARAAAKKKVKTIKKAVYISTFMCTEGFFLEARTGNAQADRGTNGGDDAILGKICLFICSYSYDIYIYIYYILYIYHDIIYIYIYIYI